MGKLTEKSDIRMLAILSWMIYFSSYISRINYGAIIVEFIATEGVLKSTASLITSVLFVTYGAGQLISGYLGDRISPRKLIFIGLIVAVICNFLMPTYSPNIPVMAVVWGINGLAQAFMWPPLVKILTSALTAKDYARVVPFTCTSSACATIAIYLAAPMIIGLSGWKTVFIVSGSVALVAAAIWFLASQKLLANVGLRMVSGIKKEAAAPRPKSELDKTMWLLLPVILITISLQGMLRDGITTWMPSFISETFKLESTVSILTGVALPVFHMIISLCIYSILKLMKHDVFNCIAMFFSVTSVLLLILYLFGMNSMILSTLLIAMAIGAVYGINALQTCYLPAMFQNSGSISFLAGLLNSATYVGSALSTYLFAVLSEKLGWGATVISWIIFSTAGLALTWICLAVLRAKKQKTKSL